jgi:hypothetical protein
MTNLVLGFLLGIVAGWFLQNRIGKVPAFQQLVDKEMAVNNRAGSVATLKSRLEMLEKRLSEIELKPVSEIPADPAELVQISSVLNSRAKSAGSLRAVDRKKARKQVIAMWDSGKPVADIASYTLLGKGEVELIISLQDSS